MLTAIRTEAVMGYKPQRVRDAGGDRVVQLLQVQDKGHIEALLTELSK